MLIGQVVRKGSEGGWGLKSLRRPLDLERRNLFRQKPEGIQRTSLAAVKISRRKVAVPFRESAQRRQQNAALSFSPRPFAGRRAQARGCFRQNGRHPSMPFRQPSPAVITEWKGEIAPPFSRGV